MMKTLRKTSPFGGEAGVLDYLTDIQQAEGFGPLPKSDVLKYVFPDGSWAAVRPSGTEPKIKFYYSVRAADESHARIRLAEITSRLHAVLGLAE